jgi:hypothetical protein
VSVEYEQKAGQSVLFYICSMRRNVLSQQIAVNLSCCHKCNQVHQLPFKRALWIDIPRKLTSDLHHYKNQVQLWPLCQFHMPTLTTQIAITETSRASQPVSLTACAYVHTANVAVIIAHRSCSERRSATVCMAICSHVAYYLDRLMQVTRVYAHPGHVSALAYSRVHRQMGSSITVSSD